MTQIKIPIENEHVSVDRFLLFWSHHNQTIIQVLIVLTLIFIVALVFLTLFGAKDETFEAKSANNGINITPDLEKSLQKMLENQTQAKSAVFDFSKGPAADSAASQPASGQAGAPSAETLAQLEKVKAEMAQRESTIRELQSQLEKAQAEKQSSSGGSGLEARIKELEARLAEYDIISEDIADLSRFKEENEKLKKQLAQMSAAPVVEIPPPPAAAQAPTPPVAATPLAPVPEPVNSELTPVPSPAAEPSPEVSAAIDDDLMKEFAAAVENQKATTAAAPTPPPPPSAENEDLMGQFENFVQKKEGT